jgi:hypothetical protein
LLPVLQLHQQHLILNIVGQLVLNIKRLQIAVEDLLQTQPQLLPLNTRETDLGQRTLQLQRVGVAEFVEGTCKFVGSAGLASDLVEQGLALELKHRA